MRLLFVLGLVCHLQSVQARRRRGHQTEEDDDWVDVSCGTYEDCLSAYDKMALACGLIGRRTDCEDETVLRFVRRHPTFQISDDDSCYAPIADKFEELVKLKGRRNELLRDCFRSGKIQGVEQELRVKADVGKKKKGTCKNKIASLEQLIAGSEDLRKILAYAESKKRDPISLSDSRCFSATKRFKSKCQRIEPCCIRVHECRRVLNSHPLVSKLKIIEDDLKENRRECKESTIIH